MLAKSLTRGRDQRKPAEVFPNKKTYTRWTLFPRGMWALFLGEANYSGLSRGHRKWWVSKTPPSLEFGATVRLTGKPPSQEAHGSRKW